MKTDQQLSELFDENAHWYHEETPDTEEFCTMNKSDFVRLARQLITEVETEINMPADECVREWFGEGDNSESYWKGGEWTNEQVCDEILKALKYFIITWQPVRNQAVKEPVKVNFICEHNLSLSGNEYAYCSKCQESFKITTEIPEPTPDIDTAEMSFNEQFEKDNEIPEEKLRDELEKYDLWQARNPNKITGSDTEIRERYLSERTNSIKL